MFESLIDFLTGSEWSYFILLGLCAADVVFPVLPSESAVIVCGIQAARGELFLPWVIAAAAAGAFSGDNSAYAGGRFLGRPVQQRLFAGAKARKRLDWAKGFLKERGSYVLIVARFIPGGRTATTFTAGLVRLAWLRRFLPYTVVAAILWALYGSLIGYLGGRTFRDQPVYALLLAFGIAGAVTLGAEAYRRLRSA